MNTQYKNDTGAGAAASSTQPTANSAAATSTTGSGSSSSASSPAAATEDVTTLSAWGKWAGVLGIAGGLFFAYKRKSNWYMYVGWALIFGGVAALAGEFGERTMKSMKD